MCIKNGVFYFLEKVTTLFKSIGSFVIYSISPRIEIGRVIYEPEHVYTIESTLKKCYVIEKIAGIQFQEARNIISGEREFWGGCCLFN